MAHPTVERVDGLLEAVPPDEPHGVIGASAGGGAHTVDRHDARVLQSAGDLGLGDEPLAADRVVGVLLEDLLQRHLAVQLAVERHEHLAKPAARVRPEQAEPLAIAGRPADRQSAGAVGVVIIVGLGGVAVLGPSDPGERGLDLGLAQLRQAGAGRAVGRDCGQAVLHVAVLLEVQRDDRFEAGAGVGVEVTPGDELVGQAPGLVAGPGLEGGDELDLVDQAVLEREQSEQEMAVSSGGGHDRSPIVGGRSGERPGIGGRPGS